MKIYSLPAELPAPEPDYSSNYDHAKEQKAEQDHMAALKAFLIKQGYTGKYTGEIYSEPAGDGSANYMVADHPRAFHLIHLPYGDAWQSRNVAFLPKKEIIRRIEATKRFHAALDAAHAKQNAVG